MSGFEHLAVLVSVVIGLAMTNILGGFGLALKSHGFLKLYWLQCLWALNLVLSMVVFWWTSYTDFVARESLHFFPFLFVLLCAFLYYLPSRLVFPDAGEACDLKTYFYTNRRQFFRVYFLLPIIYISDFIIKHVWGYAAPETSWLESLQLQWLLSIALFAIGLWYASVTDNEIYHAMFCFLFLGVAGLWMLVLIPMPN